MSLFGLVSEKSLNESREEISNLKEQLENITADNSKKDLEIQQLQQTIETLKEQLLPEHNLSLIHI